MPSDQYITTDLSEFGWREKKMAAELLTAMTEQGLPDDFGDTEVTVMMNKSSGNVFLTNSEFECAMMNGSRLESFYSCPECGSEGFAEDIHEGDDWRSLPSGCEEYLKAIEVIEEEECEECGEPMFHHKGEERTLPAVDNDKAWEAIAEEHEEDCAWVLTRGYRINQPPACLVCHTALSEGELVEGFDTCALCVIKAAREEL